MGSLRLFVIPASHPATTAALMLDLQGHRLQAHRPDAGRLQGWSCGRRASPASLVPALKIEGEKVQGSREIARGPSTGSRLTRLSSRPTRTGAPRSKTAERFGDEELQHSDPPTALVGLQTRQGEPARLLRGGQAGRPDRPRDQDRRPFGRPLGPLQRSQRRPPPVPPWRRCPTCSTGSTPTSPTARSAASSRMPPTSRSPPRSGSALTLDDLKPSDRIPPRRRPGEADRPGLPRPHPADPAPGLAAGGGLGGLRTGKGRGHPGGGPGRLWPPPRWPGPWGEAEGAGPLRDPGAGTGARRRRDAGNVTGT